MCDLPANDDATLVAKTLSGDRQSFGVLYDRYARFVRAVVRPAAVDDPAMHDLAQECFLRAYRGLDKLRVPDKFGPWLVGIARQVASEGRRRRRRDRHQFVGDEIRDVACASRSKDGIAQAEQLAAAFAEILRLPERERLAVHAFFLEERNVEQTGRLLNLSRSGTYALLARACRRLAQRLHCRSPEGETNL